MEKILITETNFPYEKYKEYFRIHFKNNNMDVLTNKELWINYNTHDKLNNKINDYIQEKNYNEYYYLPREEKDRKGGGPYYLLHEIVYHEFGNGLDAIKLWPKSIGGQYSKYKRQTERTKRAEIEKFSVGQVQHDILSNCVNNVIKDFNHLFSKEKNCCIHIRLGDALNAHFWKNEHHSWSYAPFKEAVVYKCVEESVPKDYTINIIYSSIAGGSEISHDMIKLSNQYIENLISLLKKDYQKINIFGNSHPDIDFCRAINSDIFVHGVGGFTSLMVEHRRFRKLINIDIKGERLDPNV